MQPFDATGATTSGVYARTPATAPTSLGGRADRRRAAAVLLGAGRDQRQEQLADAAAYAGEPGPAAAVFQDF